MQRERWATRIGLILAMAGNAIGLGNFLRFPGQAARNGGGAFMIPYFISLILMGIPLMWMEWAQGRFGGSRGYGTTPGMFHDMWRARISKYLGTLGIFIPTTIMIYYTYIESWTLGYSFLALIGEMPRVEPNMSPNEVLSRFEEYFTSYVGKSGEWFISVSPTAYVFFLITLALNIWILARGVARGIEALAKIAMPLLFLFAIVLVIRVFTLGAQVHPDWTPLKGLSFLWEPKWVIERSGHHIITLLDPTIWLAAAGQMFFTLSLGMGAIQTYASYLDENDDVMLTGLTTTAANEFAEVVLGGSLAIPAAVTFFGLLGALEAAGKGVFYLAFISMPAIFSYLPAGDLFGAVWFLLLFFAGFTSSVAMSQPIMAFLQEHFGVRRLNAALMLGVFYFVMTHICIFLRGGVDVMDFWAGTFGPPLLALIEVIIMMWIFGADRMWEEMHRGAELRAPRFFYYTSKYVTPLFLMLIFGGWIWQNLLPQKVYRGSIERVEFVGGEAQVTIKVDDREVVGIVKPDDGTTLLRNRKNVDLTEFEAGEEVFASHFKGSKVFSFIADEDSYYSLIARSVEGQRPGVTIWITRAVLLVMFISMCVAVGIAWRIREDARK
ncbi:MAG: sodium-dependent transporter [Armatimonadetes bacterium]|nr:sodium-dependent transporter [Armatimonadota bacterium]